jgi:23S rRNA pseudouridine2605 synthase
MPTLLRVVIDATGLSRRKAFTALREGRVTVDNAVVTDPSSAFTGGMVAFDGARLRSDKPESVYFLLNKPPGYLTSRSDERGRATVFDLVPAKARPGLHAVGRLDRDTSGLSILTNDGQLTYRLTHPKHEVEKEYWVALDRSPTMDALLRLREGIELDERRVRPKAIEILSDERGFDLSITIGEGRNRQVRRMFEAVGGQVVRLRRVREGPLRLGSLPEGAIRPLTAKEVAALYGA